MIEHRVEAVKNTYGNILKSETLMNVLTYWGGKWVQTCLHICSH